MASHTESTNNLKRNGAGFTIIELMTYVGVFGMLVGAVGVLLFWTIRTQAKVQAENEAVFQSSRAMEVMTKEIQGAKSIYIPTSLFGSDPGQLSLETDNQMPSGETSTYVDFFVCGTRLCMKRESQEPSPLTSEKVEVEQFLVTHIVTGGAPSIRVDLTILVNPIGLLEYTATVPLTFTAALRSYAE